LIIAIAACFLVLNVIGVALSSCQVTIPVQKAVDQMQEAAQQVAAASGQVSTSSQSLAEGASEQAASIEETSSSPAVTEMDKVTQHTASIAEESASASEEMNAQAEQMMQVSLSLAKIISGQFQSNNTAEEHRKTKNLIGRIRRENSTPAPDF
jgi:methyl-accepting chemotaxis protein